MTRLVPWVLLLAACGASTIRLETLPDDIDPGESAPLLTNAPTGVRRALRSADANPIRALLDEARREGRNLDSQQLLISLLVMEAQSEDECDEACLSTLELLYRMLALVADTGFQETLTWFEPWIASIDDEGAREGRRYVAFLRDVFDRAGERHDWVAARILRSSAAEHVRGEAVIGLAQRARSNRQHARARQLFGIALPMLGEHADAADVSNLARACYVVLDFACGDEARTRLRAMPESTDSLTRLDSERDAARTVAREARGLEERLARAKALVVLQRDEDAIELYDELADAHPDDARPHVGLAELVFQRQAMRFFVPNEAGIAANETMHAHLREASTRSHREVAYYGLSTVSWNFRVLARATRAGLERASSNASSNAPLFDSATVDGFRRELHTFCDDFRTFDPGSAMAFRAIGELQLAAMSRASNDERGVATLVAPLVDRIRTQLDATPDNVAIYRTAIMAAMLTHDESFITHALAATPPASPHEEPTTVARSRASLLIGLRSRDPARFIGESGDPETDALVRWASTDDPSALERLLEHAEPDARARILNNIAVALHRVGDARARELLARAEHADGWDILRYNTLALTPTAERDDAWVDALEGLVTPRSHSAVRLQAARLLSSHTGSAHASLAEARSALQRDRVPEQAAFVDGYQVGIGYTANEGITSSGKTPLPWLLVDQPPFR